MKLLLYLGRWQLSTPILYACILFIPNILSATDIYFAPTSSGTTPTLSIGETVGSDGSTQGAIAFLPPVTPATLTTVTGKASITGKAVIQ